MTAPEPELPEPDYSGSTLDRYRLVRRLGVGGMGAVYEAEHTELRKHCAVKMLRHELAQNELFRRRFLREARAASAVAHPHVVDISDFGQAPDGKVYFVMELLQGRELQQLLDEQGRLPWPRTREILLQVTSALEAAHRLGVIHRDIKPANCFLVDLPGLGGEDFVKVLDFGIAKVSSKLDESTKQLTSTQEIFGTVSYMAPEMAMGKSDDPRSDIYSLGVMMYRMLVGELPFTEGNAFQILSQHVSERPPRPRDKVPSIPEEVEAIVLKAMAKQPAERFSTMEELGQALRRGSLSTTDEPVSPQTTAVGLHASESGSRSIGEEPTIMATPLTGKRIEPTVPLGDAPVRVEPTVPLGGAPVRVEPTVPLDASASAPEMRALSEPRLARRKRSLLWVVVPVLALVAAIGSFAVLYTGSRDDTPLVAAQPAPPAPTTVPPAVAIVPPEPAPPSAEPAPPSAEPAPPEPVDAAKQAEPVAAAPTSVAEPPAATEPEAPPPKKVASPKPPKRVSGVASDAGITKRLKAKILDECRFEMAGRRVTVSFFVTQSGEITLLTASPKNAGAQCAKEQVEGTKFQPRSKDTPIKIVVE